MILAVDIGNTAIKVAAVDADRVARSARVAGGSGGRGVDAAVRRVLRGTGGASAAIVSSVNASATARVRRAVRAATGIDPMVVSVRLPLPIRVALPEPRAVGSDRLCAAVGALGGRRRHAIVIDVGSAVTVDLVVERVFRGGVILPGPAMSLSALHRFTAALPEVALGGDAVPDGIDRTALAMRLGARLGAAGGIRAAVADMDRRAGFRPGRVVTGGYAGTILPWLPRGWRRVPDLTLLGLARIAEYNR